MQLAQAAVPEFREASDWFGDSFSASGKASQRRIGRWLWVKTNGTISG